MELPLHPKLVHLPIALAVLMPVLTGVLWIALLRGWLPLRAWLLAVGAQVLLLGSSVLAMRSGENDEERVERLVPEAALEAHEEAAERFTWAAGFVLLLSLSPFLLQRRPKAANVAALATALGTCGVFWLGYEVGQAGGELVYRHGAAAAFVGGGATVGAPAAEVRRRRDD
ncbi:MAG: hypothetical protein MUC36_18030 [Planctomycetes bacterium]|jgi:uncharacterized membrane protein|nr:hypothetical protein [Planctomycetota bacterium]